MADSLTFNKWQKVLSQPEEPRIDCGVAMWGSDKLILVGGFDKNGHRLMTVEMYDISSRRWTPLPPLTKPRSYCVAEVVYNKLYVFDTLYSDGESEVLDLTRLASVSRFTPLPKCPISGVASVAVAFGPTIYLLNDLGFIAFDTRTNWWNDNLPQMLTPRSNPAVCIMDNKVVVAGGYVRPVTLFSVEVFDIANETWTIMHESMPVSSCGAAAFVVGRSDLFVVGGRCKPRSGKFTAQTNYLRYQHGRTCTWSTHNFPGMPSTIDNLGRWYYCPIAVAKAHKRLLYVGYDFVVRSLAIVDNTAFNAITYDQLIETRQLVSDTFAHEERETQVTMRDVNERIVVPICRQTGTSYARHKNPNGCKVEAFVSHSWDEPFDDFVRSIESVFQSQDKKPNLWICAFALNQCDSETIENQMGLQESSSLESTPFVTALRAASTFVVVRNSVTDLYHRIWCVCELMYAKRFGFIPNQSFVTGPDSFSDSETSCLDAESYNRRDKAKILKELLTQHNFEEIDDSIDQFRKSHALL